MPDFDLAVDEVLGVKKKEPLIEPSMSRSFTSAIKTKPDQEAEDRRIAESTGVPIGTVYNMRDEMKNKARMSDFPFEQYEQMFPNAAAVLADEEVAKIAHDDTESMGTWEKLSTSFDRGLTSSLRGHDAMGIEAATELLSFADAVDRGEVDLNNALSVRKATPHYYSMFVGAAGNMDNVNFHRRRAEASLAENAADFLRRSDYLKNLPRSRDYQRFQESRGFGPALSAFGKAPVSVAGQIASESFGAMAPTLPIVAAGGVAGGVRGLVASTAGSSFNMEYVNSLGGLFEEFGVDVNNKEAVRKLVASPEFQERNREALIKAGVVAAFDAATAGAAGVRMARSPVTNLAAQTGVQAAGGGAGEAAGSVASGQDINAADVLAEMIGEGATASVDVGVLALERMRNRAKYAEAAEKDAQILEAMNQVESKLKERDPEAFRKFVDQASETGPVQDVYIDPNVLDQAGIDPEALKEISPSFREQADVAREAGGSVRIPVSEYATDIAGTELGQSLIDHLKTDPGGMSRAEAKAFMQSSKEEFKAEAEKILADSQAESVTEASRQAVYSDVLTQLEKAGRFTNDVNEQYAALWSNFFTVMGARVNMDPQELFSKYGPTVTSEISQGDSLNLGQRVKRFLQGDKYLSLPDTLNIPRAPTPEELTSFGRTEDVPLDKALATEGRHLRQKDKFKRGEHPGELIKGFGDKPVAVRWSNGQYLIIDGHHRTEAALSEDKRSLPMHVIDAKDYNPGADRKPSNNKSDISDDDLLRELGILKQRKRGSFQPGSNIISLLKDADLSTFLHESGHFFLEVLNDLALQEDAPAEIKADMDSVLKWFGIEGEQIPKGKITLPIEDITAFEEGRVIAQVNIRDNPQDAAAATKGPVDVVKLPDGRTYLLNGFHRYEMARKNKDSSIDVRYSSFDEYTAERVNRELGTNFVAEKATALGRWNQLTLEEQRPYHEQFARGFEAYLFEGKSPSLDMQGVFRRFRAWLLNVYRNLRALNVSLNSEVRSVFDRMLASNEEIRNAEAFHNMNPMFATAEDAGMSPEEFKAYQELGLEASQDAIDNLQERGMRDMKWLSNAKGKKLKELQKLADEKRRTIKRQVTEEVLNEPINKARNFFRYGKIDGKEIEGPHRIDVDAVKDLYDGDVPAGIPTKYGQYGILGKDGLHPDQAAEMFGFSSGDELIQTLINEEEPRDKIEGITDQRMLEKYGDLVDPKAVEQAADAAIHNDVRTRFIATEANALAKATGGRKILNSAAKELAESIIARLQVKKIRPSRYTSAEARASREADNARRKGDIEMAATFKRHQLVQNHSAKAAMRAIDEIDKGIKYLTKFNKDSSRKNIDVDYLDQIDALLERFDLRKGVSQKQLRKRASFAEWLKAQEELGFEPDIDSAQLDELNRKHYKDMTVEEFRGLRDAIKQIEHLGRLKTKLLTARDERQYGAIRETIINSINDNASGKQIDLRTRANVGGTLKELGSNFLAIHRKAASILREMDGFKDGGPLWEYFVRSMNEAGDKETVMREQATVRLTELTKDILKKGRMGGKGDFFPTINTSLNREERIGIALNMGNEGNKQRLLDGEGWTIEQLQPVLDSISKEEWDFVQNVWDFFESYRPEIAAKERRVYGKEPEWVEPSAVQTPHGEYKGGYYPIVYDPNRSARAESDEASKEAQQSLRAARMAATTSRSFTKKRADKVVDRPLMYSMRGLFRGASEVIHDLSWHEWVIDANKILRDKGIDQAMRKNYGAEIKKQLSNAVQDIARGDVPALDAFDRSINHIRFGATIAGLGWNITTALLQPLGLTNSMVRIGPGWVSRGIVSWLKSPVDTVDEIYAKSDFMRLRGKTMQREINEIENRITGAKSKPRELVDLSMFYLIQKLQMVADVPTWLGQYEKAVAEGNSEVRAAELADQAVIDAQGGGTIKDLAAIQRGGPTRKLFTNFYSYFNVVHNLSVEIGKRTDWKNPVEAAIAARDYILLFVVPAVLSAGIREGLKGNIEDEDDLLQAIAQEQVSYLMGTVVGVRELTGAASRLAGLDYKFDYKAPAGLRFFNELDYMTKQIEQGDVDKALRKSVLNTTGILFHLPTGQVNRVWDGTQALVEGETDNPLAPLLGVPYKGR